MIDRKKIHKWNYEQNGEIKFTKLLEIETAREIIEEYPLFTLGGNIYYYEDGVYSSRDSTKKIINIISEISFPELTTYNKAKNIISLIKEFSQVDYKDLNRYPNSSYINFKNGMYNPISKRLEDHDPKFFSINQIPYELDKRFVIDEGIKLKNIPTFNRFLTTSIPDEEDREMLLQFLAYCFTMSMEAQKALFIVGEAGTGKSVLLRLVMKILGHDNVSSVKLQDLSKPFSSAEIVGKLLNCDGDLNAQALQDVSTFKNITGQDSILVEEKYQKPFTIQPYSKMMYSMNRIPKNIDEKSEGYYRRLLILRVPKRGEEIYNLENELEKEIPMIIGLLVTKLNTLSQNNFKLFESTSSKREVIRLRENTDSIQQFINLYVIKVEGQRTKAKEVHEKYKNYCAEFGRVEIGRNTFYEELENRGYKRMPRDGYDCFCDIMVTERASDIEISLFSGKAMNYKENSTYKK